MIPFGEATLHYDSLDHKRRALGSTTSDLFCRPLPEAINGDFSYIGYHLASMNKFVSHFICRVDYGPISYSLLDILRNKQSSTKREYPPVGTTIIVFLEQHFQRD